MIKDRIDAVMGRKPFDCVVRNVNIVNVYTETAERGIVGIVGKYIAYVGKDFGPETKMTVDGGGEWLLPGFIDAHMHIESSMLSPMNFAKVALSCGTTTVMADPHEICNVLGMKGVYALKDAMKGMPFRVLMMAPSTVPSAPGFETSGCEISADEVAEMLDAKGIYGLGEVMDFNGVVEADPKMISILEKAADAECITDGHASLLTGRRLQAFRASGIDSDHTVQNEEKLKEILSLGFCAQVQGSALNTDTVKVMMSTHAQENICLVTDDVSLPTLMSKGQLNFVFSKAVECGLEPLKAVRYTTLNAARRLRLYQVGAIAPGMIADLQLVKDIRAPKPDMVWYGGNLVFDRNKGYSYMPCSVENHEALCHTVHLCRKVTEDDVRIRVRTPSVVINTIHQDGKTTRTKRVPVCFKVSDDGTPELNGYVKLAVFNRYGLDRHSIAYVDGYPEFCGAVALTYGHDCHNLAVYGTDDSDMVLAANTVAEAEGGLCAVLNGRILSLVRLPLGGLMSEEEPEELFRQQTKFLRSCESMGMVHTDLLRFLTLMQLAVSPEFKCTDQGLIDVVNKEFVQLVNETAEGGAQS